MQEFKKSEAGASGRSPIVFCLSVHFVCINFPCRLRPRRHAAPPPFALCLPLFVVSLLEGVEGLVSLELEVHISSSELFVDVRDGIELVASVAEVNFVGLIEVHFDKALAISLDARALADDVRGQAEVVEDGIEDVRKGAGARALLAFMQFDPLGLDRALGGQEDVGAQALLELNDELAVHLLQRVDARIRHKDKDNILGLLLVLCDLVRADGGDEDVLHINVRAVSDVLPNLSDLSFDVAERGFLEISLVESALDVCAHFFV